MLKSISGGAFSTKDSIADLYEAKKKKLDPVGQEDSDIDNDGDSDESDEYLANRRKSIKKAIDKRLVKEAQKKKLDPVGKEDDDIDNDGDSDESDEYLANRRKTIGKAMKNVKLSGKKDEVKIHNPTNEDYDLDEVLDTREAKKRASARARQAADDAQKDYLSGKTKDSSKWERKSRQFMKFKSKLKKKLVDVDEESIDEIFGLSAKERAAKKQSEFEKNERAKREKRVRIQKNYDRYGLMAKEELDLTESDYPIYHKSYTSAIDAARAYAKKQGYDFDEDSYFNQVSSGQRKPSPGKTNMMRVQLTKNGQPTKKGMQIQVYGMDNGSYELNTYVESFNIQEKSTSIVQQRLMGMAYAYKKGEMDDASPEVKKLADSMTLKQLKDFASTKHEGLPLRKKEYVSEAAPTGSNKIDPEMRYAINNLLDKMADSMASSYRKSPNYAKHKDDFEEIINDWEKHLSYSVLGKYIRIDTKHGVEQFIVKNDGGGYKKGDVLRPKGYKGPNLRAGVHGNILDPNYRLPGMMEETMYEATDTSKDARWWKSAYDANWWLDAYKENEDKNYHSENLEMLAMLFGSASEKKYAKEKVAHQNSLSYKSFPVNKAMESKINKYYYKLVKLAGMNEETMYEAAPTGSNKIDDPELKKALNKHLGSIADFNASRYRNHPDYYRNKNDFEKTIAQFEKKLSYSIVGKYIRIDLPTGPHQFIVMKNGGRLKKGDILRPKSSGRGIKTYSDKTPDLKGGVQGNILGMNEETMHEVAMAGYSHKGFPKPNPENFRANILDKMKKATGEEKKILAAKARKAGATQKELKDAMNEATITPMDAKFWLEKYKENEDDNYHSENLELLAMLFGSTSEKKYAKEKVAHQNSLSYDNFPVNKAMESKINRYYYKLTKLASMNEEIIEMSDQAALKACKQLSEYGIDQSTKFFANGAIRSYARNKSFTPDQIVGIQKGMKNSGLKMANESVNNKGYSKINKLIEKRHSNSPSSREYGTDSLVKKYKQVTPGQVVESVVQYNSRDPYRIFEAMVHYILGSSISNIDDLSFELMERTGHVKISDRRGPFGIISVTDVRNFYENNELTMDDFIEMLEDFGVNEVPFDDYEIGYSKKFNNVTEEYVAEEDDDDEISDTMKIYLKTLDADAKYSKNGFLTKKD